MKVCNLLLVAAVANSLAIRTPQNANGNDGPKKANHRLGFKQHKAMRLRMPFKSANSASDQGEPSNEWSVEHQADYAMKAKFKDDSDNEDGAHVDESDLGLGSLADIFVDEGSDPTFTAKFKSGGFGDMFWQLLSVGKDLTIEKINILKDILAMLDQIKNIRGKDAEESVAISVVDGDTQESIEFRKEMLNLLMLKISTI